jgi:hypothetical protein
MAAPFHRDETFEAISRRAFILGVANGILFGFASAFVDGTTVLPVFVNKVSSSSLAVGALAAVGTGGWLLPQLVAANFIQAKKKKMPVYRAMSLIRGACWPMAAAAVALLGKTNPGAALGVFFITYASFTLAGGVGTLAFMDVAARAIPINKFSRFWGARQVGGGILAILAGIVAKQVLATDSSLMAFAKLFAMASVVFVFALGSFSAVREPPGGSYTEQRAPLFRFLLQAPQVLRRDRLFRRLFEVRLLASAAGLAGPFYIVYCRENLAMPDSMLATYLMSQVVGGIMSNFIWAPVGEKHGSRTLLSASLWAGLAVPLMAFAVSSLAVAASDARLIFTGIFFLMGTVASGSSIANTNYLLEVAPDEERPLYIGLMNTLLATATIFPLLGAVVVDVVSYQAVFALSAAATLGAVFLTLRLAPGREA